MDRRGHDRRKFPSTFSSVHVSVPLVREISSWMSIASSLAVNLRFAAFNCGRFRSVLDCLTVR